MIRKSLQKIRPTSTVKLESDRKWSLRSSDSRSVGSVRNSPNAADAFRLIEFKFPEWFMGRRVNDINNSFYIDRVKKITKNT